MIPLSGWTLRRSVQHLQFLDHHPCCFDCNLAVLISTRFYSEDVKMYSCMFQICDERFKHVVAYLNVRSKSHVM